MKPASHVDHLARLFLGGVVALTVAGCGVGHGEAANGSLVGEVTVADSASRAAGLLLQAAAPAPAAGTSYTLRSIQYSGGPSTPVFGYRVVNSKGQFIASGGGVQLFYAGTGGEFTPIATPPGETVRSVRQVLGLNESGLVVARGSSARYDSTGAPEHVEENAFAWQASTGLAVIFGNRAGFGPLAVSDSGMVAGSRFWFGAPPEAFRYTIDAGLSVVHDNAVVLWMNNGDTILAARNAETLITIAPDGTQSDVLPTLPWFGDGAGYIDDHGVVYADASNGATVVRDGAAIIIGSQCLPPPGGCPGTDCIELTRFVSFNAAGHAVGHDGVQYTSTFGDPAYLPTGGFHWNAATGSSLVKVGTSDGFPLSVNKDGVVVGNTADGHAFVWTRSSGGVALDTLLANAPLQSGEYLQAVAIGDGGHIVATVCCGKDQPIVLLTPSASVNP
jgi:hypothetical protein